MLHILMFLAIILSIVKANDLLVIPTFVLVFCWGMSFFSWIIYSYAKGLTDGINKKMNEQIVELKDKLNKYEQGENKK